MDSKRVNKSRRAIINSALSLGVLGAVTPSQWTKPVVHAVVVPAHAVMSPIVCPDIVIGEVVISTMGSGDVQCALSFSVFSANETALTITSITNSPLSLGSEVSYETFPVDVTDEVGTLVAWTGGFGTIECGVGSEFASDVVFTVEATCEGADEPITMDFSLSDIAVMS